MRYISNLEFEEQFIIWLIRQKRTLNYERNQHIWVILNKILPKKEAFRIYNSLSKLIFFLPKIEKSNKKRNKINIEEEKILSLYSLGIEKDKSLISKKIVNSLNINERDNISFINELIKIKKIINKSNNCLLKPKIINSSCVETSLNSFQFIMIRSLRIWYKALQEDLDMFGMLYKYHIEIDYSAITISFHSIIEKIVLDKKKNLKINCIDCKRLSLDEIKFLEIIELSIASKWKSCEKIIETYFKIQQPINLIILLKQFAINLFVIENNNLDTLKAISNIDYIKSNSISKFTHLNKNKYIN
ncbi:MAG: hypothetical protein CMM49_01840 [Rhodospirillaceae bacterium]|nr:hypothetical protein [Rhodospirillaceae bacterium]|tara:strand:+ start:31382 stop:32287 length:906 start_codon:yes stop_codon:yes gene_type:complete